jgi:hypothetical protein
VAERITVLPRDDPLWFTWDAKTNGAFFTTLLTAGLKASGQEVCSTVSTYGVADLLLSLLMSPPEASFFFFFFFFFVALFILRVKCKDNKREKKGLVQQ